MANVKISALPAVSAIANDNVLPIVSGGVTTKVPVRQSGASYIPFVDADSALIAAANFDVTSIKSTTAPDISSTDVGALAKNGVFKGGSMTDTPGASSQDHIVISAGSTTQRIQLAQNINNPSDLYCRLINYINVRAWFNIFTSGSSSMEPSCSVVPATHNTYDLGTTAKRWKDLWLQSGVFNGSDARLKTEIKPFTAKEIEASKQLSKEIGTYQWLESVAEKGDKARRHVGMTVQRVIEIMEKNGLNPFDYGFIGYDKWDDTIVHHEESKAAKAQHAELDKDGNVVKDATPEIKYQKAWDEVVLKAGDSFSFRYDELNQFIARGFEARLTALEAIK